MITDPRGGLVALGMAEAGELTEPIDDPARLVLRFNSANLSEEMRQWLFSLEVMAKAVREEYIAKENDDG